MKILNFILGLLLFIASALLLAGGALAIQFSSSFPKVVAYFTRKRDLFFHRRRPIGFSY